MRFLPLQEGAYETISRPRKARYGKRKPKR